jgi:hypothetical protein
MKIARFHVTPELLRELFHLPRGTEVVYAEMDHHDIAVTIEHPDLRDVDLVEGERPPLIRPVFHREAEIVMLEDWGQG